MSRATKPLLGCGADKRTAAAGLLRKKRTITLKLVAVVAIIIAADKTRTVGAVIKQI